MLGRMAAVSTIGRIIPSLDDPRRNLIRDAWNRLSGVPGGKLVFSKMIGRAAPYTGTIDARVESLAAGRSEVTLRDRRAVRQHLRSIHAIALANLAELAGNVALAYTIPADARFIVAGMSIEYLKKARGTIRAIGESPIIETSDEHEYDVTVRMIDAAGDEVARATLRTLVGPKKKPSGS